MNIEEIYLGDMKRREKRLSDILKLYWENDDSKEAVALKRLGNDYNSLYKDYRTYYYNRKSIIYENSYYKSLDNFKKKYEELKIGEITWNDETYPQSVREVAMLCQDAFKEAERLNTHLQQEDNLELDWKNNETILNSYIEDLHRTEKFYLTNSTEFSKMKNALEKISKIQQEYKGSKLTPEVFKIMENAYSDAYNAATEYVDKKSVIPKTEHGRERLNMAKRLKQYLGDMSGKFERRIRVQEEYDKAIAPFEKFEHGTREQIEKYLNIPRNVEQIDDLGGFRIRRSGINECMVILIGRGFPVEDVMNPEKMIEEKQSVGREYMEHTKNADDMWLARELTAGQKAMIDYLLDLEKNKQIDYSMLGKKTVGDKLPLLNQVARTLFDITQELSGEAVLKSTQQMVLKETLQKERGQENPVTDEEISKIQNDITDQATNISGYIVGIADGKIAERKLQSDGGEEVVEVGDSTVNWQNLILQSLIAEKLRQEVKMAEGQKTIDKIVDSRLKEYVRIFLTSSKEFDELEEFKENPKMRNWIRTLAREGRLGELGDVKIEYDDKKEIKNVTLQWNQKMITPKTQYERDLERYEKFMAPYRKYQALTGEMKKIYLGKENEQKSIPDMGSFRIERSGINACMAIMIARGYPVEEVLNTEKLLDEKRKVGTEYMEHAAKKDDSWLVRGMSEGQQKLLEYLLKEGKGTVDYAELGKGSADGKLPVLLQASSTLFDITQELTQSPKMKEGQKEAIKEQLKQKGKEDNSFLNQKVERICENLTMQALNASSYIRNMFNGREAEILMQLDMGNQITRYDATISSWSILSCDILCAEKIRQMYKNSDKNINEAMDFRAMTIMNFCLKDVPENKKLGEMRENPEYAEQMKRLAANHKYGESCEVKLSFDESGMISEVKLEQKNNKDKKQLEDKKDMQKEKNTEKTL